MKAPDYIAVARNIICIGRNYKCHAKEMNSPVPSEPFFFLKPTTALVQSPNPIIIPKDVYVDHEVELGLVVKKTGRNIKEADAMSYVKGYALCLDMTARKIQEEAKEQGLDWCMAKGFDTFCAVGPFVHREKIQDPHSLELQLEVNGEVKQKGNTRDMVFKIPEIISYVSRYMTIRENDLILTGTPKGIGQVVPGDVLKGSLHHDLARFVFKAVEEKFPENSKDNMLKI